MANKVLLFRGIDHKGLHEKKFLVFAQLAAGLCLLLHLWLKNPKLMQLSTKLHCNLMLSTDFFFPFFLSWPQKSLV